MTNIYLPINTKVLVKGAEFKVVCHTAANELNLANIETGKPLLISVSEFTSMIVNGDAEIERIGRSKGGHRQSSIKRSFESFSAEHQAEARRRLKYVKAVDEGIAGHALSSTVKDVLRLFSNENGPRQPSVRTVERWYRAWSDGDRDIRALLPADYLKGRRIKTLDDRVVEILNEVIEDFYLIPTPHRVNRLYQIVRDRILKENKEKSPASKLSVPHIRKIYRYVRALDPYEVKVAHHGKRAANAIFDAIGAGVTAAYPLQIVQVDHHLVDLQLVLNSGTILGRPWLTVALDLYSRMVVGFYLSFDAPSYISVMRCLRHSILPKEVFLSQIVQQLKQFSETSFEPGFLSNWPCFGLIDTLVVDNGLEFHSQHLLDSAEQLGISVEYSPAREPHYKGPVERWFGTLNTKLIHTLPGTTFSNPAMRGSYPSEKESCLTIEMLEFLLTKFIVDDYSNSPHKRLNCTPAEKWSEGTRKNPVHFISNQQDLNVLLFKVETRTLGRHGVTIAGLPYQSDAIQLLRRHLIGNSSLGLKNPKVRVKVDPEDLSTVYVEDRENKVFIPANCIYETYSLQLSTWRHKVIRDSISGDGVNPDKVSEEELLDRRLSVFEAAQKLVSDARKSKRKRAYRYKNEEQRALEAHQSSNPIGIDETSSSLEEDDYLIPFNSPEEMDEQLNLRGWRASSASDVAKPHDKGDGYGDA